MWNRKKTGSTGSSGSSGKGEPVVSPNINATYAITGGRPAIAGDD